MKIRTTLTMLCFGFISAVSFAANSATIFEDSFESANMSATNPEGFRWENNNRTSVVMQHPTDGPVAVYNNGTIYNIHDSTYTDGTARYWNAKEGLYSLRFNYPAGETWAEQRFNMGTAQRDLWISYWLRVPTNFTYGSGSRTNNKFFAIWMDGYENQGNGSSVWLSMAPSGDGAALEFTYSNGGGSGAVAFEQRTPFFSGSDRGRWMQLVFHVKAESTEGADDGVIQTFRRWDGEASFTKLHEKLNAPLRVPDGGPYGFVRGYILGWANAPYATDTEWLLDNFTLADTPLLAVQVVPKPPSLLAVQ